MTHKLGIDKGGYVGHSQLDVSTVKPTRGMLLIKPSERKPMSDGGIILPESLKDKKAESGVVVARGLPPRDKKTGEELPFPAETGDIVYYAWTAGTEVKTAQGVFLMLMSDELIAVEQ